MNRLLFKHWLVKEMADYGFDTDQRNKPKGGTETVDGNVPFNPIDGSKIITELAKLPAIGPNEPYQKWNDVVEWGSGPGAIQVGVTPLGSMRIVVRRNVKNLIGESTWVCTKIIPLSDNESEDHELSIAHEVYNQITEISGQMIPGPTSEYDDLERLSWKMWQAVKRDHPSYIMFPIGLRKQNEDYFKMVFEFRGHGVLRQKNCGGGRAEQFNIDLVWDKRKGMIRCMGYNIDSTDRQHSWEVQPAEFDEWFSPKQDQTEIINCVTETFLQY